MPNLIAISPKDTPYLAVTWQVNNFCNYRCSYCNEGNWSGSYTNEDKIDVLIENLEKIIKYYQDNGYVYFKFYYSGGEPTLWKGLIPVSNFLKDRLGHNVTLGINTNLSRKISWWEKHYQLFDDVVASYHPEFANKSNYLEIAEFLQNKVNYLCLRMMLLEEKFDDMLVVGNEIKTKLKNYNLEWVPLLDEMSVVAGPWKYKDPRISDFISKNNFESKITIYKPEPKTVIASVEKYDDGTTKTLNSNRIIAENRNFFQGWKCKVQESIFISPSGTMRAASCGQGPSLGNIFDVFKLTLNDVTCQKDYCHCGTDILITKEK
jgi:organic radical activating enzyme